MKRSYGCFRVVSLVLFAGVLPLSAQSNTSNVPVFHAESRLVLVDVIAKDAKGNPVQGLKADDFTIIDSGKRQTIRSFDEHRSPAVAESPAKEPLFSDLPSGVYTNWQPVPKSGAVNIILFDSLNTRWEDQAYARLQLIRVLQSIPSGQQMALYALGDHLRIIQSLSGSSDTLIAAANKLGALSKLEGRNHQADAVVALSALGAGTPPDSAGVYNPDHPRTQADALMEFLQEETNAIDQRRIEMTLESFRELARSVAAIPGRKNLIWISGSFPLTIGSATERAIQGKSLMLFDRELRKTTALLAAHQIAIYPIDARGLMTGRVLADGTGIPVTTTKGQMTQVAQFRNDQLQTHTTMDELAEQTGGRAFYNSNALSTAIADSISEGSHYYTIAYTPANKDWDSRLRNITVRTSRKDLTLLYRRGYYAVADPFAPTLKIKTTKEDVQKRLIEAVQPNAQQVNAILMKAQARLLAPTEKGIPVEVDYVMDARGFTVPTEDSGKRNLRYQLVVVAWNDDEKNAGQAWQMINVDLPAEDVTERMANGIRSKRVLTLAPGAYQVYVGVIDENSKKIGTVVIPLKVQKSKGWISAK